VIFPYRFDICLKKVKKPACKIIYICKIKCLEVLFMVGLELHPKGLDSKKSAKEVDIIRWVAENISRSKVDVEECPSCFAWTLLCECRSNDSFRYEFITKMWMKLLPTKTQLDESESERLSYDGKITSDLIDRMILIRDKAEEELRETELRELESSRPQSVFEFAKPDNMEEDEEDVSSTIGDTDGE
jgi:hypothetical protein